MQISLLWLDKVSTLEHSPEEIQAKVDGYANIVGQECLIVPFASDRVKSVEEDDQAEERGRANSKVWLEGCLENQSVSINALCFESGMEASIGDANTDPCEEGTNRGKVLKPSEDLCRTCRAGKIGDEGDGASDQDTPDRNATLGALEQESGRLTVLSKSVQVA